MLNSKNKIFSLHNALVHNLVPKKEFENQTEFKHEELEPAVTSPSYAPLTPNAKSFDFFEEKLYRMSECEKTMTRKELQKTGVSAAKINGSEPYVIIPGDRKNKPVELFRPSSFQKEIAYSKQDKTKSKELETKPFSYKKGLKINIQNSFNVFLNGRNEDSEYPYISNQDFFATLVFQKNSIELTVVVDIPLSSVSRANFEIMRSDIRKILKPFTAKFTKTLEIMEKDLIDTFFKRIGYEHNLIIDKDQDFADQIKEQFEKILAKEDQKSTLLSLLSNKPYHEHFPARRLSRKIIIYEAPTNSGKTYTACNEVKKLIDSNLEAKAVCVFPLRALAAQIKDEFMEQGYACSLITGEEREEEPGARIESITAEIMSVAKPYDIAFVDESQLLFDPSRGAAYARAIIGAYSNTLILAVAPAYKNALMYWIKTVLPDDEIEEVELKRLCPLHPIEKTITAKQVEKGDIIVAFSAKEIHRIAAELSQDYKVGVIYGKMSPSARRAMVRDFMEEGFDVLIATDAIGMGISIPAKRVLFSAIDKYDGEDRRMLTSEEIRQIAGRAGRYGFYDEGFYGTYALKNCDFHIQRSVTMILPEPIPAKLSIAPDKHIFMSAENLSLTKTIRVWRKAAENDFYTINEKVLLDISNKASFLDLKTAEKEQLVGLLFVTFSEERFEEYQKHADEVLNGAQLSDYRFKGKPGSVEYFEDYSQWLTLVSQLQRIYPDLCPEESWIRQEMDECGEGMTELLKNMYG